MHGIGRTEDTIGTRWPSRPTHLPRRARGVASSGLVAPGDIQMRMASRFINEAATLQDTTNEVALTFAFAAIYHPVETSPQGGSIQGEMTRWLALMPVALYGLYLFVQYQDTLDHESDEDVSDIRPGREWGRLALSLVVIVVGVEGLVRAAINFGEIFGTPSFLWGITVVAAGTSIPDAFVSIRAARQGRGVTSIANVLGSNTFDLLVCIPAGVLIAGTAVIDFSLAAPMMAALTFATVLLFLMMRTHMILSRRESICLLVVYAAFVVWVSLESFGTIDLVPPLPPSGAVSAHATTG